MVSVKIRQYPPAATLSGAAVEMTQGDLLVATSRKFPARLPEVIARSFLLSRSTANPPVDPADGDRYLVPIGGTGAWAGQDGQAAEFLYVPNNDGASTGSWFFTECYGVNLVLDEGLILGFAPGGVVIPIVPTQGTVVTQENIDAAPDVGFIMVDLSLGPVAIGLVELDADAFICVKDLLGLASRDVPINAAGTIDGLDNPQLVYAARGWAWIKYTKAIGAHGTWSLVG